jgi:hypothetical protein
MMGAALRGCFSRADANREREENQKKERFHEETQAFAILGIFNAFSGLFFSDLRNCNRHEAK